MSSTETLLMTRFAQTWTDCPVASVTGSVPPQLALPAHSKNVGLSLNVLQVCMWVWTVFVSRPAKPKLHPRLQLIHRFSWNFNHKLCNTKPISGTGTCVPPVFELFKLKDFFSPRWNKHAWCMLHRPHTDLCIVRVSTQERHANTNQNHKLGLCYVGSWASAENSTLTFNRTLCEGFQLYLRGCHCFGSLQAYKRCLREAAVTEAPGYSLIITVS